jgi:hypothetical protein
MIFAARLPELFLRRSSGNPRMPCNANRPKMLMIYVILFRESFLLISPL